MQLAPSVRFGRSAAVLLLSVWKPQLWRLVGRVAGIYDALTVSTTRYSWEKERESRGYCGRLANSPRNSRRPLPAVFILTLRCSRVAASKPVRNAPTTARWRSIKKKARLPCESRACGYIDQSSVSRFSISSRWASISSWRSILACLSNSKMLIVCPSTIVRIVHWMMRR